MKHLKVYLTQTHQKTLMVLRCGFGTLLVLAGWISHASTAAIGMVEEKKLARNDYLQNENLPEILSPREEQALQTRKMKVHARDLNAGLGTKNLASMHSRAPWNKLYEYIRANWSLLVKDGFIGLPIQAKYLWCTFIFIQIPAEVAVPFPRVALKWIAKTKSEAVQTIIKKANVFFDKIIERTKEEFLTTIVIGRPFSFEDDLEFIKRIPQLLKNNPLDVLKWLAKIDYRFI